MAGLHTAAELRRASDLAHRAAGLVLGTVAFLAIVDALGLAQATYASVLAAFGILFVLAMFLHHGLGQVGRVWSFVLADEQQRQHLVLALLIALSGLGEVAGIRAALPLGLGTMAILFLRHSQHGTEEAVTAATAAHRRLGAGLLAAAVARALALVAPVPAIELLWAAVLFVPAALLLAYREPAGAYEAQHHTPAGGHPA